VRRRRRDEAHSPRAGTRRPAADAAVAAEAEDEGARGCGAVAREHAGRGRGTRVGLHGRPARAVEPSRSGEEELTGRRCHGGSADCRGKITFEKCVSEGGDLSVRVHK